MIPRAVGGLEPDETEQQALTDLYGLARTALAGTGFDDRENRLRWACDAFCKERPDVARKWVWCWAVDNLGVFLRKGD